jgi:hypothetical protein
MTITIPTRDLCGIIADAIPFALPDDDLPALAAVRVEWDATRLHAMATDGYRVGWSTWDPDDAPPADEQPDLFTEPGGADDPWHAYLPVADARALVAAYKLPPKEAGCPLSVGMLDGLFTVARVRESGHPALTMTIAGVTGIEPPDIRALLAGHTAVEPVKEIAYTGRWLADFGAKVRQTGPLRLTFCDRITLVNIGERFTGAIVPVRDGDGVTS